MVPDFASQVTVNLVRVVVHVLDFEIGVKLPILNEIDHLLLSCGQVDVRKSVIDVKSMRVVSNKSYG